MNTLREHIKNNSFARFYLLYGSEDYLVSSYKKLLVNALKGDGDEMNFSHFEGKLESVSDICEVAETLPFFADRRVLLIEDSGLFSYANDFADNIKDFPDSTVVVFVEKSVDKRTKLFKTVKELGYACELEPLPPHELKRFVAGYLGKAGKRISEGICDYLLDSCGTDMYTLAGELEKLIAFCDNRSVIEKRDVDEVVTIQLSNRIFDMVDAISLHNKTKALSLYADLIALREKPIGILTLIRNHYNRLLGIYKMRQEHASDSEIATALKLPSWTLKKYYGMLRGMDYERLKHCVEYATEIETDFKSGRLTDQIGVEIMIVKLASM